LRHGAVYDSLPVAKGVAMSKSELTDAQWSKIEALLPTPKRSRKGGRVFTANRPCFEGILWVLRSGARWRDLPPEYPSYSTCRRRLIQWEESGVWLKAWHTLLDRLDRRGWLRWEQCFADGTFSPAKRGANASAKPPAERVRSLWWWRTAREFLWRPERTRRRGRK
jgi:transposase